MKIKFFKTLSILTLLSMLAVAVAQPVFAAGNSSAMNAAQTEASGPTDPTEFEAFLDAYLAK